MGVIHWWTLGARRTGNPGQHCSSPWISGFRGGTLTPQSPGETRSPGNSGIHDLHTLDSIIRDGTNLSWWHKSHPTCLFYFLSYWGIIWACDPWSNLLCQVSEMVFPVLGLGMGGMKWTSGGSRKRAGERHRGQWGELQWRLLTSEEEVEPYSCNHNIQQTADGGLPGLSCEFCDSLGYMAVIKKNKNN